MNIEYFLTLENYATDERKTRRKAYNKSQEYFTPYFTVKQMADKIPIEQWCDPTKTWIDPCYGNGQFICYIIWKRLTNGIDWETTLKTVYGVEFVEQNVNETHDRIIKLLHEMQIDFNENTARNIIKSNIVYADFFEWDFNKFGKLNFALMNPPYSYRENPHIDGKFFEKINTFTDETICIMPEKIHTLTGNILHVINSKHIKTIDIIPVNEVFKDVHPTWKCVAIYHSINNKTFNTIDATYKNKTTTIKLDKESRLNYCKEIYINKKFISIVKNRENLYNDLLNKYGRMTFDTNDFIYEENDARGHSISVEGKKKPIQEHLSRVKDYLKNGLYKYCIYKGSYNNDKMKIKDWHGEDPDTLFKGHICWLTNKENVKNNLIYWFECPLFNIWRKYYLYFSCTAARGKYWVLPAVDFNKSEQDFKKYIDVLTEFTQDEINELIKLNIL